ncbi:MAG: phosphoribosylglycinamide formyltransferase [Prevotellaceae bacterium]|jgi:phosphoribosylglycinamide formyltransferase-1|nr:phosphoribosylglycinamide formyltransferase [Prevotellaceae bacterium]
MKKNIAIFASGSGSNAENIVKYFSKTPEFSFIIVSNKKDAYVLARAENLGVKSCFFLKEDFVSGEKILDFLLTNHVDFIVLAGFLLKIPAILIENYPNKIVNIHPALLPKYGGRGMYGDNVHRAVKAAGEAESGITIHYVNQNYDGGDIIFQARCAIAPTDTPEKIAEKVHRLEYEYFPKIIEKSLKNKIE